LKTTVCAIIAGPTELSQFLL